MYIQLSHFVRGEVQREHELTPGHSSTAELGGIQILFCYFVSSPPHSCHKIRTKPWALLLVGKCSTIEQPLEVCAIMFSNKFLKFIFIIWGRWSQDRVCPCSLDVPKLALWSRLLAYLCLLSAEHWD